MTKELIKQLLINSYYKGEVVTLKRVHRALDGNTKSYTDFYEYCTKELLPKKQKELRYGGYKKYVTEVNKLKEFSPKLSFIDIDHKFAEEYFYCLTE